MYTNFHNRVAEKQSLTRVLKSSKSELFIVYGRRGVGKSALLESVVSESGSRYLYYRATRRTLSIQLEDLTADVKEAFGEEFIGGELNSLASFLDVLGSLASQRDKKGEGEPVIVILDELPYLAEVDEGFLTTLQHWWDKNKRRSNIKLFLAGSHVSFMEQQVLDVAAPLYNRRTGQMKLEALDYLHASLFFPQRSSIEKATLYAILGGMPSYLEQFDPKLTIERNVKEQCLRERTYLSEEPDWLLLEDLRKNTMYGSILRAIASGNRKPSDIAKAIGKESAQDVAPHLETLRALGLVVREVPITEKLNARSRSSLYLISDNYLEFWYRFIDGSRSLIARGLGERVWEKMIKDNIDLYISKPVFERMSRDYLWHALRAKQLPKNLHFTDVGSWWGKGDIEIDVVAVNEKAKVTAVGSCKWTKAKVDVKEYSELQNACLRAEIEQEFVHYFLFSKTGFTERLANLAKNNDSVHLVTIDDMYQF